MQPGTHDHSIIDEIESDFRLPGILRRSFHEETSPSDFRLSFDTEKHKFEENHRSKTTFGKRDLDFCAVFPLISEAWG